MAARAARSVGRLLRAGVRVDRSQSDPVIALRNTIGVAAPLVIGAALGSVTGGLAAAIGALQTAFADRPGPYRLRAARMLGTAAVAAVTSVLAVLVSRHDAGGVVLLILLALGAGLLVTAGPSATQVGTAGVAAALVLGHLSQPAAAALPVGGLVLAGGALQALLAVSAWPLRRHRPERQVLAALYRSLAAAARTPHGTDAAPPAAAELDAARLTLFGLGHDHGPSVEAYRVLFDEAARLRRELLVLEALVHRLADHSAEPRPDPSADPSDGPRSDGDTDSGAAGTVRVALDAAADLAAGIARALDRGQGVDAVAVRRSCDTLDCAVETLAATPRADHGDEQPDRPINPTTRRAAARRLRALAGQLRAAVASVDPAASEGAHDTSDDPRAVERLRDPLAVLRANLTPDSAVLRHALRVALLVGGSDLVTRLAGFPRGYWVALTVLVVLRPDFGSTLRRSVLRTLGTIVGLLVVSELVRWVPGGVWWQIAVVAVCFFGQRLAGPNNIALSAFGLSGLVVVLLALNGVPPHDTLVERSVATAVGGAVAVLASLLLFPSWERDRFRTRLGDLLAAYAAYLRALAEPAPDRAELTRRRVAARLMRSNAQASLDRVEADPVPDRGEVDLGRAVLSHSHRVVQAALTVDALCPDLTVTTATALRSFLTAAADELAGVEGVVRGARETAPPDRPAGARSGRPTLRDAYLEFAARAEPADGTERTDAQAAAETTAGVLDAADRITDAVDTIAEQVGRSRVDGPAHSLASTP